MYKSPSLNISMSGSLIATNWPLWYFIHNLQLCCWIGYWELMRYTSWHLPHKLKVPPPSYFPPLLLSHCTMCCLYSTITLYPKIEIQNPLSHGQILFLRSFFLCSLRMKILKLVSRFIFGSGNIISGTLTICTNNPEISNLEFALHGFLMAFQPIKLGQIYVKWYIKTKN